MKKVNLIFLVLSLFLVCFIISCNQNHEPKYTVWTESYSYENYESVFTSAPKEYQFVKVEISSDLVAEYSKRFSDNNKHDWTQARIKTWLINCGFSDSQAEEETSYIINKEHCIIEIRIKNIIYVLLK